jgi:ABC-type transport system substrate-binding protein
MVRFVTRGANPPNSNNWGFFNSDEMETLVRTARTTFDGAARDAALAALHKRIVEEAPFLWVAHDVGPRMMSPRVTGVVQPRSWFIDIATMDMR